MAPPDDVRVEPGIPADAPAVFALLVDALGATSLPVTVYRDPRAVAWLAELLARPVPEVFVARRLAGVLGVAHVVSVGDACHLNHVAVAAGCRGQGVGATLLAAFGARGRELGARRLSLDVYAREVSTVAWYTRHGFREHARAVHLRLAVPPRPADDGGWLVPALQLQTAAAAIGRVGFGRVEAVRGDARLTLGLIGDDVLRLLDAGGLPLADVLAAAGALFGGRRRELVIVNAPARPDVEGLLAVDEVLRLERPA